VHPFPSFLVAAVTVGLVPLADSGASPWLYAQLGPGMLLYQFAIGAANDVVDARDDAEAKPGKPIPSGRVTLGAARTVAAASLLGGLAVTAPMDLTAWLVGIAAVSCGLAYDFRLKRTRLSWLPLSVALPLVPAWVFVAAGEWSTVLWWAFPIGVLLGAAVHFANELPDIRPGARTRGAVHEAGRRRSYAVAMGAFGAGASIATVVLALTEPVRGILAAIVSVLAFSLAPRSTRLFGRDGLFGVLAMATAVLAVVFVSAV
jgi:4-hydroxybenzoate polyprenyltransferase